MSGHWDEPAAAPGGGEHDLVAAYALDAVDGAERTRAEEHLAGCAPCRVEVEELRAALLATVAPVAPAPASKTAVMARLADVEQLPPLPAAVPVAEVPVAPASSTAAGGPTAPAAPVDELALRRARRARRAATWVAAAAVAVLVVGGGALGTTAAHLRSARDDARAQASALAQVAGSRDARTVAATASASSSWSGTSVVVSRAEHRAVLVPSGAASAGSGHTWQMWFVTGGRARSAGLLSSTSVAADALAGSTGAATVVAVTREPSGGSKVPTTTPVATFALPA